jgi:hypothetical protein
MTAFHGAGAVPLAVHLSATFSKTAVVIIAKSAGRRVFGLATAGVRLA